MSNQLSELKFLNLPSAGIESPYRTYVFKEILRDVKKNMEGKYQVN